MSTKLQNTLNQLKVLLLCGLVVLITQAVNLKGQMDIGRNVPGMAILVAISLVSLKVKEALPLQIPAFAWASLISLLLTTPWSPVQQLVLDMTAQSSQTGTVILAIAGVSIGCKLGDIKKLSWKIVLIAFIVFIGTFFGSALVAQAILKAQGII